MLRASTQCHAAARRPAVSSGLTLGGRWSQPLQRSQLRTSVAQRAATLAHQVYELNDVDRAKLATELGYSTIGKELPNGVTLADIVKTMPPEVFDLDMPKAWSAVAISVVSLAASLYLISVCPWYLLPLAWAMSGTALTGWFVVGHDCAHRSFCKNNLLEDIVGTLAFMPIIFPYEPWRIGHNTHHAHTNKLKVDTAWHPVPESDADKLSGVSGAMTRAFLGSPLKLWASVGHWLIWHFDLNRFNEKQKPRVIVSLAACAAFAVIGLPAIVHFTGFWGLVKYWLMPWLGYHFWMSTFTVIHHTAPHIPFKQASEWNAAKAQLGGTVHCDFPGWVDFLTHDIAWHVPHHVNSRIPWYNLRKATVSLRENWGQYMTEGTFNWRMMKNIFTQCHVYDEVTNYKPFDFRKEEEFFGVQRAVLPNSM